MAGEQALAGALQQLSVQAATDLEVIWQSVSDAAEAQEGLADILPAIIDMYGSGAEALAAEWYERAREQVGARGSFAAMIPDHPNSGAVELSRWGVGPLYQQKPDWNAARQLVAGGLQRRIWDANRRVIMHSSIIDPQSRGWQRLAGGGSCGFCRMLESRGGVYNSESVQFGSHDNCNCVATPAWKFEPNRVEKFSASELDIPDKDKARAKQWMAANLPT